LSSVKVSFPRFSLEDVVEEANRTAHALSKHLGLEKVILFGSYAKKRYTAASDIDLLVVFDGSKSSEDKVYKTLIRTIKLPRLELHILSIKDYMLMKDTKWIETIESEGVVILNHKDA
jgi:predicted nucleotidyltransferase